MNEPHWRLVPAASLTPIPWKNGLGTTRDVVTVTGPDGALRWQVSIADLVQDAAFSHFPHCDRIFTPIAGDPPPELAFHDGPFEPCPLLVPKPFPGDIPTRSRIPAPGRAFNAIVDRRHHEATVEIAESPTRSPNHGVIYCHTGQITAANQTLHPGDSLVGQGPITLKTTPNTKAIIVTITQPP